MNNVDNNLNNQIISRRLLVDRNNFNALVLQANSKKIDPPKGKLLPNHNPITNLAIDTVDIAKDAKNLATAITKGKSDDHKLGRMNDLGLKIGGLGIAAYLATKRVTKTTKMMEFVGFGAFMASMAIWPKLFINLPVKIKHGFDPDQKYQDSQGRKKSFFIDNQFLPWDQWSGKKIDKIGDHMGVDKDMPDRDEFTQKKMQKTALQARTLWMLTAGPATPLLTAMICNRAEKGLEKFNIYNTLKQAHKNLEGADKAINRTLSTPGFDAETSNALKELLDRHKGKEIDTAFFEEVADLINPLGIVKKNTDGDSLKVISGIGYTGISKEIAQELQDLCKTGSPKVEFSAGEIAKTLTDSFAGQVKKMNIFDDAVNVGTEELTSILKGIKGEANLGIDEAVDILMGEGITVKGGNMLDALKGLIKPEQTKESYEAISKKIIEFYETSKHSKAKLSVFEKFVNALGGKRAESYYTQAYGEISEGLLKELDPSLADLNIARKGSEEAADFIRKSFEGFAENLGNANSEQGRMSYFVKNMGKRIGKLGEHLDKDTEKPKDVYKTFSEKLAALFPSVTQDGSPLTGSLQNADIKIGTALQDFVDVSRLGVENTGYRTLMALDLERRIKILKDTVGEEVFAQKHKDIVEIARDIIYKGTSISLAEPKVVAQNITPNVQSSYNEALEFLFKKDMDSTFVAVLEKDKSLNPILKKLEDARKQMFAIISKGEAATQMESDALGKPIAEFFQENAGKAFNNRSWMRIFGIATLSLIGITLFAQMFFGKMKKEEKHYKAKGAENAK